jgi:hypothetical protein
MRRSLPLVLAALALAGCSSGGAKPISIAPAGTYHLANFAPAGKLAAEGPERLSFTVDQPSGAPLTKYRTGPGPHTGVHLIIVRSDLGAIIHQHPKPGPDGGLAQDVVFPTPGRYRAVIDVYPALSGVYRNFQLFRWLDVAGRYTPQPLPPFKPVDIVHGYRFVLRSKPRLRAIQASLLDFTVTDPSGKPAQFTAWFGALAHAIFFRAGTLDYFHTHVCSPGTTGCASVLGGAHVVGTSAAPGILHVGVLVPAPGTWRLFLQCRVNGQILTAPFTLKVRS